MLVWNSKWLETIQKTFFAGSSTYGSSLTPFLGVKVIVKSFGIVRWPKIEED